MKNIKKFIAAGMLLVLASSCDDAINITPDGELGNDLTFQTVSDLEKFLNGSIYTSVSTSTQIGFTSVFTDEVGIGDANGGQGLELHRWLFNVDDGYASSLWLQEYTLINRVNRLLEAAAKITPVVDPDNGIDETADYNSILGQARLLRAYAYLELETYYSTDMSNDGALGVMLVDHVPAIDERIPRATNADIFTFMEEDLAFADSNLVDHTATPYYYASRNLISAIRARFYLYRKNYTLARQYAQQTIDDAAASAVVLTPGTPFTNTTTGAGIYSATTNNPYRRIWLDLSRGECIFNLSRPTSGTTLGDIAGTWYFNTTNLTGGAFHDMGRNLYNKLKGDPVVVGATTFPSADVRWYSFVDNTRKEDPDYATSADYVNSDVLPIDKYPGKTGAPLRNDLKVFRLSEMYFILAECAANDNDLAGVANNLKLIRDARKAVGPVQPTATYANATAAWADIMDERRKELCFEGFRYIDVKRLGVLAGKSLERDPTDDSIKTLPTTLPSTDYRFTFPIPQDELNANPLVQNPGYSE